MEASWWAWLEMQIDAWAFESQQPELEDILCLNGSDESLMTLRGGNLGNKKSHKSSVYELSQLFIYSRKNTKRFILL